ncbi:MAG: hypothetical protein ACHQF2_03595 [Flavobacteriales bacterium]
MQAVIARFLLLFSICLSLGCLTRYSFNKKLREKGYSKSVFHLEKSNEWTGFRNVCEWKKQDE